MHPSSVSAVRSFVLVLCIPSRNRAMYVWKSYRSRRRRKKKRAAVRRVATRFTNLWSLSGCRWSSWRRRLETVDRETGRAASRPRFRGTRLPTLDNRDKLVYDGQRNNTETVQVRDRLVASRLFLKNACCENQSSAGHEAALCFPTKYLNSSYDDFVERSSRLLLDIDIWLVEIGTVCEEEKRDELHLLFVK